MQFYEHEEALRAALTAFMRDGIEAGEHLIVIASADCRAALIDSLSAEGVTLGDGRIHTFDAAQTLAAFMIGDMPDAKLFRATVGALVERVAPQAAGRRARAYAEMVDVLWERGNHRAAIRLDELWNELADAASFSLLRAYRMGRFLVAEDAAGRQLIGPAHAQATSGPHVLEAEIAQRKQVEAALRNELAERRRAERALHDAKQELEDFFENSLEGLHRVGPDGTILWANQAELDLLGYRADEYVGHHIAEFHADPAAIDDVLRRLSKNEALVNYEARLKAKDGSIKHVLIHSNVLFRNGAFVHTRCFTRDITEPKRLETELRRHADALERERERLEASEVEHRRARADAEAAAAAITRLNRIAALMNAAQLDMQRIGQALIEETTALVDAELGAFFCVPHEGADLMTMVAGTIDNQLARTLTPRRPGDLHRFAARGIVRATDIARAGPHEYLFHADPPGVRPVRSYLAAPILSRAGRLLGGLVFGHGAPDRFTVRHEAMLASVAVLAAAAIENAKLYQESREAAAAELRRSNAAALAAKVGAVLTRGGPLRDVLATCCRAIVEHLDAEFAQVWTVDATGTTLELLASAGPAMQVDAARARVPIGQSEIGHVAATRRPHITNDADRSRGSSEVAFAGYPLLVEDRLIGVLAMFARHALPSSTPDALAALADTISIGIERLRVDVEREALVTQLKETVRLNELFAGILAHDLRNPLGAILAACQLVRSRTSDEQITKPLARLEASADRMAHMISQVLDMARLRQGGGFVIEPTPTDLDGICREVLDELRLAHPGWQIAMSSSGDTAGMWDRGSLLQVFSNLAGNAVKHGKIDGGMHLEIDGSDAAAVAVRVANQGSIPDAVRPHLFDPFYGTQHRENGGGGRGLGLGLYITKQIVSAHGGEIAVRSSSVDEQTEFVVRLPRSQSPLT